MICPKCKNEGVLNHAAGQHFYYCRTCKDEILLEEAVDEPNGNVKFGDIDLRDKDAENMIKDWMLKGAFPPGPVFSTHADKPCTVQSHFVKIGNLRCTCGDINYSTNSAPTPKFPSHSRNVHVNGLVDVPCNGGQHYIKAGSSTCTCGGFNGYP